MKAAVEKNFWTILICILVLQFAAGLWHISFPFTEGRFHYNWNPPFWIERAQILNTVGLAHSYFGLADYRSHPELIGPVIALWTRAAGYSEASIRILALTLTVFGTLFLSLAVKTFLDPRRALYFAAIFAALPLIYIYGKMINQEQLVTLFLGVHLWGIARIHQKEKWGYALAAVGAFGMAASDFSGAVLACATAGAGFVLWQRKTHENAAIRFAMISLMSAGMAIALYLLQSYLQSAKDSVRAVGGGLFESWKYRAGVSSAFSWSGWIYQQYQFLIQNYSIPLFLAGIFTLFAVALKKIFAEDSRVRTVSIVAAAIFGGALAYMMAVPQASSIHIYFQYFLSVPIAIGLVFGADWLASKITAIDFDRASFAIFGILLFGTAYYTVTRYQALLYYPSGVDETDIVLIKTLHDVPASRSIIAVEVEPFRASWYGNPNVKYYAGRDIPAYILANGFPYADYQIVPRTYAEQFVEEINTKHAFGKDIAATKGDCSNHLCILNLGKR